MNKKYKISELHRFDITEELKTEEDIALYLKVTLEEDPSFLPEALGDVARARGMSALAKDTGITREALDRALSPDGNPTYDTLRKVLSAFNVTLTVLPAKQPADLVVTS